MRLSKDAPSVPCRLVRTADVVDGNDGAVALCPVSWSNTVFLLFFAFSLIVIDEKRINIGPNQL